MLSRLQISVAQLNTGNISEKLKPELDNYCIICINQEILASKIIYKSLIDFI